jgi:hypothetical protein
MPNKAGKPLPDESVLFAEAYSAKLDVNNNPITGADGFYMIQRRRCNDGRLIVGFPPGGAAAVGALQNRGTDSTPKLMASTD